MTDAPEVLKIWRKCSTCKKGIPVCSLYYRCSVSTCRSKSTGFAFCTVSCWDAHIGFYNHRNAYAEEETAPATPESVIDQPAVVTRAPIVNKEDVVTEENESKKTIVFRAPTAADQVEVETLIVVSKVKALVRQRSEFNTSQCFVDALTRKVVEQTLKGIERAKVAGRKTVMGRDLE